MHEPVLFHKLIANASFAVNSNSDIIILTLVGALIQLQVKMAVMVLHPARSVCLQGLNRCTFAGCMMPKMDDNT